ncbi:hypothetical protein P8452_51549 [Trifolium repens]|nr:hypothetical protein P8452_51549 [Trifolium repens]
MNPGCLQRPRGHKTQEGEPQPEPQPQAQPQEGEPQPDPPEIQVEIPLSQSGPVQQQILSQEVPNIVETSGHRQEGKTHGLRGPVVYPNSFGVRPPFPQQRGAAPVAGPALPQQRGAAPLKRVSFPKSGLDTNEPDFMYFIPNQVMRPDYPK